MNKTSDNAMDADMGGASGNVSTGKTQPNEKSSKKIEISELPKEMLEEILIHLDDKDMLKASHVCTLFASVVETAFARKYSKKWYSIERNWHANNPTKPLDKVMLNKYGGKMRKIQIDSCSDELLELVEQKCDNVKSLKLRGVSRIIMLKDLKEYYSEAMPNLGHETLAKFIDLNPRLEALQFRSNHSDLIAMLDSRLNNLKTLKYYNGVSIDRPLPPIGLPALEALHLALRTTADYIRLLQSLNCNQIKELVLLTLQDPNGNADDVIREIRQFKSLVSLGLPNYREFAVGIADGGSELAEKIHSITSMLPQLSKLEIKLDDRDFDRLSNELKKSANSFHDRFAKSNTEIILKSSYKTMSITTDYLFMVHAGSVELHWMNNLDEENVRKVLISANTLIFVNHCADRTFDIAAFAHKRIHCLDFKSNGPISVKPNVLRYQDWFPHLRMLKIHLEQHSAKDFLRNLDENFCEQIRVLWLNAKGDADDSDMKNILTKFGDLCSLHVGP